MTGSKNNSIQKKTRVSAWLAGCIAILIALAGCSDQQKDSAPQAAKPKPAEAKPAPKVYKFSDKETQILKLLIKDDLVTFIEGGEGMLKYNNIPTLVTADKMQRDYEKNEVAGDNAYRKKVLIVTGKVASVDRGLGENYFIKLRGGSNQFITPNANMDDGYRDYLANLNKGDEVSLVCTCDGMLLGSATLKKCMPLDDWSNIVADEFIKGISKGIETKDKNTINLAALAVYFVSKNPTNELFAEGADKKQLLTEIISSFGKIPKEEREKIFAKIAAERFDYVRANPVENKAAN